MQQMSQLRKFYKNWEQAANRGLSTLVGDAASRGLAGSPNTLAGLVASAYAPFQARAGEGWASTIPGVAGPVNPFDSFLKSLEAVRSAYPSKPADTGINFGYSSSRAGTSELPRTAGLDIGGFPIADTSLFGEQ